MKTNASKTEGTEYISKDVVRLLKDQYGWTLKKIGEAINCGESFVSMVGNGHRSFTLDHLTMLEKKLGEPVAILLLKSIETNPEMSTPSMGRTGYVEGTFIITEVCCHLSQKGGDFRQE